MLSIYNKAGASYTRIFEVLETEPAVVNDGQIQIYRESEDCIEFRHVSFAYEQKNVLNDLNFTIKRGQTIGIIGGTGSGKSTLIHLIPRFYEATQGQIYIKNKPIQDYSLYSLRQMIGLVPQQATLFTGTIKENICLAKENASDDEVKQALHLAQASFVDEWKDGIYSHITQGGHNLSGGQKQRLTIARALVRNPELLILDDSASALDFATDAALRKAIATLPQTTIIVSQRVSAIMHADKILVLSHGELVGMGKHDELMKTCEIYQQIVTSQMSKEVA